jgi:hypothetical protein
MDSRLLIAVLAMGAAVVGAAVERLRDRGSAGRVIRRRHGSNRTGIARSLPRRGARGWFHAQLSFRLYYENRSIIFRAPAAWDYTACENQQYRVDSLRPSASVTSVAPEDILAPVFQAAAVGEPSLAPTTIRFDVSAFAGTPSGYGSPK